MRPLSPLARLALVTIALVAGACEEPRAAPTETWTPADHAQPPAQRSAANTEAPTRPRRSEAEVRRQAARTLFGMTCASCHGANGSGPSTPPEDGSEVPDLTSAAWQASVTSERIAESIARGRGTMPGFGRQLAPQAIVALVEHVRSLGPSAEGTGANAPEDAPTEDAPAEDTPTEDAPTEDAR